MPERKNIDQKTDAKSNVGGRLQLKIANWAELEISPPRSGVSSAGIWLAVILALGVVGLAFAKAEWFTYAILAASLTGLFVLMVFRHLIHVTANQIFRRKDPAESGPQPPRKDSTG